MEAITYSIHGKNGKTPESLRGSKSLSEVCEEADSFMAWNPPKTPITSPEGKIEYYNKHSFYTIVPNVFPIRRPVVGAANQLN